MIQAIRWNVSSVGAQHGRMHLPAVKDAARLPLTLGLLMAAGYNYVRHEAFDIPGLH
ncbi:MAG: hypothetical protein MI923_17185 [Phycisphaerales bacterium]|nr:hypothetical protein [Phycisphaerales bacterium]